MENKMTNKKENKGSYGVIRRTTHESRGGYSFSEKSYVSGLEKEEAESLSDHLNHKGGAFRYYKDEYSPSHEYYYTYFVKLNSEIAINKDNLLSPSFLEIITMDKEFMKFKKNKNKLNVEEIIKNWQRIYVPTSIYLSHGADDFEGGIATISKIENGRVSISGRPLCSYDLEFLLENQLEYKIRYGASKAHASPDNNPEFNEGW